jgi:hypothetical protein
MDLLSRIPIPRHLTSQLWLVTLPSALASFERRQKLPKLPIGAARYAGIPLIAAGAGLAVWARRKDAKIPYDGPMSHLAERPATTGGIVVLAGVSLLTRSAVLAAYAVGLVFASGSHSVKIDEPDLAGFLRLGR